MFHFFAAAVINIIFAVAPILRIGFNKVLTLLEPSVFWFPYLASPVACFTVMYFQSASNSSAIAEAREVLIPCPISEREANKIMLPSFCICTNKFGVKVPLS